MDRTTSSSSIGAALKKVESFQYPATHVGHLTDSQAKSLGAFKQLCEQKGYFKPQTSAASASHDDETMLRYLRARKFVPEEAWKQFKDTEDWRRSEKIDELYETIDVVEYDETRRLYPQWTGRRDKRGIPVYVFEVAHLTSKRMSAYEKSISKSSTAGKTSPKLIRLFALYENLLRFTMPLCSAVPGRPYAETPVSQSNNIVDISGVSLRQFWNLRQHMQDASQLANAHYPETLDRIFVIGAPSFFPTVWAWIKGWFDPITVSKIFILSKENVKPTLARYIDLANVPRKYGGTLDWEWGTLPSLDPEIEGALKWENPAKSENGQHGFPPGPIKWVKSSSGDITAVAVGTENGRKREVSVAHLKVQQGLTVGPLSAQLSRLSTDQDPMFGQPSTSGTHTHPLEDQEYFPVTGTTPPDERDDVSLRNGSQDMGATGETGGQLPSNDPNSVVAGQYDHGGRQGTSSTRYTEQASTLAHGQHAEHTPNTVDHGYGDKTSTIEPSTIGQAQKNVDIPKTTPADETQQQQQQQQQQPGYLEQARNAASGVAVAATGVGSAVLAKVGLGGSSETDHATETSTATAEAGKAAEEKKSDSRVDAMEDKDVEAFMRSQYSTSNNMGNRPVDKVQEQMKQ